MNTDLHARFISLKYNTNNSITFFDRQGVKISKSYAEVYKDIMSLSLTLRNNGALKNSGNVVVCGAMSYEWLVSAISCIVSGCTPVALPETLSEEELSETLKDIPIHSIISENKTLLGSDFSYCTQYSLDDVNGIITQGASTGEAVPIFVADQVIAFTSGSTSSKRLKAFAVSLESSLVFSKRFIELFSIQHDDNWLICHTFSHIVHFEYALGGLLAGYDLTLCSVVHLLMQGKSLLPSVVVTVPSVYDKIAEQIERQYTFEKNGSELLTKLKQTLVVDDSGKVVRQPLSQAAKQVLGDRIKMMLIGASPSPTDLQIFLLQNGVPLFEGYGMSEVNMISCNHPKLSKLSTTGPAWPGMDVKLDKDHNVLVRTTPIRSEKYINGTESENAETYLHDEWINTGDVGKIDGDGCLKIIGRSKDTIVNSGGKNINPSSIETKLMNIPGISHAVVYGDNKPYLVALLSPTSSVNDVDNELLSRSIETINDSLPNHEKVLDFLVLDKELNEKEGTLTRSGKPRRQKIISHYENEFLALYA